MYLDIFSVLNCELLANISCNSFAKALIAADYKDVVVALNNIKSFSTTNIISLIEFNYDGKTMCIGYLVEYDNDKDRYVIKLDDVYYIDLSGGYYVFDETVKCNFADIKKYAFHSYEAISPAMVLAIDVLIEKLQGKTVETCGRLIKD